MPKVLKDISTGKGRAVSLFAKLIPLEPHVEMPGEIKIILEGIIDEG
jgi:hypothetical protein